MINLIHEEPHGALKTPYVIEETQETIYVLHVDDESDQLVLTKRFLEGADPAINIESFPSPKEAFQALKHGSFDCIVSDYVMSEMDGISLARFIREESQIPFILYTGKGSEEVAREAFAAGIDDYLRKEIDPSHFQVLAKRVRTAVEKRRAEYARAQANKQFEAKLFSLHRHAAELSRAENMKDIATSTFKAIDHVLGFNMVSFSIIEGNVLREIFSWGIEIDEIFEQPLDGPGVTVRAVRTGETQLVSDTRLDEDFVLGPAEGVYDPLSELAVPIIVDSEPVAVINIESSDLNAFSEEDKKLMEIFAEHIASALRGIKFLESEQLYQGKLAALHRSALKLAAAKNIEEVCSIAIGSIEGVLGFIWAGIGLIERNAIRYCIHTGFSLPDYWALPLDGPGVTVRAVRTGETQFIPDIRLDEDYVVGPAEGIYKPLSELVVPVKIDGESVAVINIESTELDAFSIEDKELLETLSQHVASAIARLRNVEILRTSEERYHALLESSPDAVCVISDEKFAYVNKRHVEMSGFNDPSDLIGMKAIEYVAPEDKKRAMKRIRGRPKGEEYPNRYELKLQKKDGTIIDVETHVSVIDYEGRPSSLAFIRDISERKKAEEELLRSVEQVKSLLEFQNKVIDTAIVWIDLLDEEGNVILWNRAAELLSGYSREEVMGHKRIWEWLYPDHDYRVKIFNQAKNIIEGQAVENYETTIRCKDGSLKTILWYDNNILDEAGKSIGSIAVGIDITEQNRMEEEIKSSEERWRSLIELAPDGILTMNIQGVITSINTALLKITGFSKDEIVGKNFSELGNIRASDIPRLKKLFRSFLEGKISAPVEYIYKYRDGTRRWGEAHYSLIEVGKTREILAVLRDITGHKKMEKELRSYAENLQQMVNRKTRELLDAERMGVAGKIAAMVGHDLRGPLQSIKNAIDVLKIKPEMEEKMLKIIEASVHRATRMLEELRHQTRDSPLNIITLDLEALIQGVIEEAQIPDSVHVSIRLEEGLNDIPVDQMKLRRVLDNLIRNALDAMLEGGTLTIEAERMDKKIVLKISDTGVGIPEEEIPKLFKPFCSMKPGGLGLGLAYCKRAVEMHQGKITVNSKTDVGTTFMVTIPVENCLSKPDANLEVNL